MNHSIKHTVIVGLVFGLVVYALAHFGVWKLMGLSAPHGLLYQGFLFLGFYFVLSRFVFEPFAQVFEERENQTVKKKKSIEELEIQFRSLSEQYKSQMEKGRIQAILEREKIALEAENMEKQKILKTKDQAQKQFEQALLKIERESLQTKDQLKGQVTQIKDDVCQWVMGEKTNTGHERIRVLS